MQSYITYTCRIHIDAMNYRRVKTSLEKYVPLILFVRLRVRGSWRLNKECYILTSPAPPDIAVCCSRSPGLLNQGARGLSFLLSFSTTSCHQRVSKLYRGFQRPLLPGGGFLYHTSSLTHLISNSLTSCPHRVI